MKKFKTMSYEPQWDHYHATIEDAQVAAGDRSYDRYVGIYELVQVVKLNRTIEVIEDLEKAEADLLAEHAETMKGYNCDNVSMPQVGGN